MLLPTLRLGFLVAPASLQPALHAAKRLTDWNGELATQAALARFIDRGLLARHIRTVAREYAARQARIVETLERRFSAWLRPIPAAAGLHLAAELAPGVAIDIPHVVGRAAEAGVRVHALSDFYTGTPVRDGLAIGFGSIRTADIEEGLRRLAASFAERPRGRAAR